MIVVDDEAPAREIVTEYLASDERFEVVAQCANGYEAVRAVADRRPDLLFLDIQMPKLDGFEVLELLEQKPKVVFVTAYDEYAIRAFEVRAVDYLLKPFTAARFAEVLERAADAVRRDRPQALDELAGDVAAARGPLQRIVVRDGSAIEVVPVQRIDYLEAQDDYVCIVTRGRKLSKQKTLSELGEQLDAARFIRVHRSYIVNLESLARVEPYAKDSRVAILKDGTRVPVSRAGWERLRGML